jgi:ribosomal protein S18 acetylase RimI-like enzyme
VLEVRRAWLDDLYDAYEVEAAYDRAHLGEPEFTVEHVRASWTHDSWVARREGAAVGFAGFTHGRMRVWAQEDEARERLLAALLEHAPRALSTIFPAGDAALADLLEREGFERKHEVWRMEVELGGQLAEPAWPEGVTVRTFRDGDARAVHRLLDEAYRTTGQGDEDRFEDWEPAMMGDPSFDPELWFLAEAEGELVGACLNWREGFVKDIVVAAEWRGRGLGEALLRHAFRELAARGVDRVGLKVDSNNPTGAHRLYERVGMRTAQTYAVFERR